MYVLMKIEIKNNYDGSLEYMQDDVVGTYEKVDDAIEVMNADADKTIACGYFDKVIFRSNKRVQLHNGGTAYMIYAIHECRL